MIHKIYSLERISDNEWYILCIIYFFNIPIWHFYISDNGFPFEKYFEADLEKQKLVRIEKEELKYRDFKLLFLITLIIILYVI